MAYFLTYKFFKSKNFNNFLERDNMNLYMTLVLVL